MSRHDTNVVGVDQAGRVLALIINGKGPYFPVFLYCLMNSTAG